MLNHQNLFKYIKATKYSYMLSILVCDAKMHFKNGKDVQTGFCKKCSCFSLITHIFKQLKCVLYRYQYVDLSIKMEKQNIINHL